MKVRFQKHLCLIFSLNLLCDCHWLELCLWTFLFVLSEIDEFPYKGAVHERLSNFINQKLAYNVVIYLERKDITLDLNQKAKK